MKRVFAVFLFVAVANGGVTKLSSRSKLSRNPYGLTKFMIGGTEAQLGQVPYMVAIQPVDGKLEFCGGSIIHSRWVLTAGQCIEGVTEFMMTFGSRYRGGSPYGMYLESKRSVLHDDYRFVEDPNDPTGQTYFIENDIGLIQLPRHLPWTNDIPEMAPILRSINLVVIKNEQCEQGFGLGEGIRPKIEPFHICTDTRNGRSVFIGDIGGPMVWQDTTGTDRQVGIASFSREDGSGPIGYPNGFTRLASYLDWIEAVTGMEIEP